MKFCNGKYEFKVQDGNLICLRYGEPWRDFIGDGAVSMLFDRAQELRKALEDVSNDAADILGSGHPSVERARELLEQ